MRLAGSPPVFVGVVHLLPLPGGPTPSAGLDAVLARAVLDAHALARGGADAVIVENLGDAPFEADRVEPFTVAAMTRVVMAVTAAVGGLPVGVNVLRNDAEAAMSIAAATGAAFVRVNVHTGVMVTDQGVIEGRARSTLLLRRRLGTAAVVVADVLVKHAVPLGAWTLENAARDAALRGRADALVVTGDGTGQPTDPEALRRVRAAVPQIPVWVGSGLDPQTVAAFPALDGAIVGTYLHADGDVGRPVDEARVTAMRTALSSQAANNES